MNKKLIAVAAVSLLLSATSVFAGTTKGGLGFRTLNGPFNALENTGVGFTVTPAIGVRQWFTESVGFDAAIGFTSLKAVGSPPTTTFDEGTGFAIELGMPFILKQMDKVNFIVRPGFLYGKSTATDKIATGLPDEFEAKLLSFSGELEVEYMLTDNLSLSAAHGIAYSSSKVSDNRPTFPTSPTLELKGFETTGSNFTQLGFHIYLW